MSVANRKHELAAIQVYDECDTKLENVGLVRCYDLEYENEMWIDTSSAKVRHEYEKAWYERRQRVASITSRCGVEYLSIRTDKDYVKVLREMFRRRALR